MKSSYISWDDTTVIDTAYHALKAGKAILSTTDTVVGLLAMPTVEGKDILDRLKNRDKKPYILIAPSLQEVLKYIETPSRAVTLLMNECWPGPLTLILSPSKFLERGLLYKGTIAIRVPAHKGLQQLLSKTGPLLSTSANISGMPTPAGLAEVAPSIVQGCAVVVGDPSCPPCVVASTILDCSKDTVQVVREGAYSLEEIILKTAHQVAITRAS